VEIVLPDHKVDEIHIQILGLVPSPERTLEFGVTTAGKSSRPDEASETREMDTGEVSLTEA